MTQRPKHNNLLTVWHERNAQHGRLFCSIQPAHCVWVWV